MEIKKVKKVSDLIYYISIAFAIIVIGKNYYDRASLPEGVCPVSNNYSLIIFAITLLIISFIVTSVIDRLNKKSGNKQDKRDIGEE